MISCPNCGGNPRFDIASQKLLCPHCGSSFDAATFPEETSGAEMHNVTGEEAGRPDRMQVTIYTCSQCGGELMSMDNEAAAFCSYCGTHQILEERLSLQERPGKIIPFKITKEDCKKTYEGRLRMSPFAPKELKDPNYIDEFRSIYMPYWFYCFEQKGTVMLKGTEEHRKGDYRIIDDYRLTADVDNSFDGITHDASTAFDDKISESLAPYEIKDAVPFRTTYLSGYYADIPDVEKTTYRFESEYMAAKDTMNTLMDIEEFQDYSPKEVDDSAVVSRTHTVLKSAETAMFPVWFLSYRKNDRVAYAAINGQTGKMTADIPIDPPRYLAGVGILAAIFWIILQTFNIASLREILMNVIFGSLAGALVYGMVIYKLEENIINRAWETWLRERMQKKRERMAREAGGRIEEEEDDDDDDSTPPERKNSAPGILITVLIWLGFIAAAAILMVIGWGAMIAAEPILAAVYVQMGFHEKTSGRGMISNWCLAGATVLGVLVWAINPYIDILYYGSCVLMMVCVVWCFFDGLYYYNQLMTRPLPQFQNKRGKDLA